MKKFLIAIWSYPLQGILWLLTYVVLGIRTITGWIFRLGAIIAFIVDFVNLCNGTHNFGIFSAWFALILFIFLIPWFFERMSYGGAVLADNISYWRTGKFMEYNNKKAVRQAEEEQAAIRAAKEAQKEQEAAAQKEAALAAPAAEPKPEKKNPMSGGRYFGPASEGNVIRPL